LQAEAESFLCPQLQMEYGEPGLKPEEGKASQARHPDQPQEKVIPKTAAGRVKVDMALALEQASTEAKCLKWIA